MKRYLRLSLVIAYPYLILLSIVCLFKGYFMESIFQNNIFYVLAFLLIVYVLALVSSVAVLIISFIRKDSAEQLLRMNMIIKLIHIPAYLFIFIIGLIFTITIFTLPASIILMSWIV